MYDYFSKATKNLSLCKLSPKLIPTDFAQSILIIFLSMRLIFMISHSLFVLNADRCRFCNIFKERHFSPFWFSVALYMNADMGLAPYDAIPAIISHRSHLPFTLIRILWDFSAILIGILAGKHLSFATVVMALTIGPSVTFVKSPLCFFCFSRKKV